MEAGWHWDLLEVEYDSSIEKSYSALPMQASNIGVSFEPPIEEISKVMLDRAYKAKKIFGGTYWLSILSPPPKEEDMVFPSKAVPAKSVPAMDKGKKTMEIHYHKRRNVFARRKQLVLVVSKVSPKDSTKSPI